MASITDPFRDIFLAGVGALAIGAEKSQDIIQQLVEKGQLTVNQGKEIAADLKDTASAKSQEVRDDIIAAHMKAMTREERDAFVAKITKLANDVNEANDADGASDANDASDTGNVNNAGEVDDANGTGEAAKADDEATNITS